MFWFLRIIIITLLGFHHLFHLSESSEAETRLVNYLFKSQEYNPLIRPVSHISEIIEVTMGLTLFQVITVEERTQVMKTNTWLRLNWSDYQLVWDPNKYDGIYELKLPCELGWKPDVVLLNNADGKYEVSFCSQLVIHSDGVIEWIPPTIYKSSCTIDVRYFPFDEQECSMNFGSWTFTADQLKLTPGTKCELSDYVPSGTWDLIDCRPRASEDNSTSKYSEVEYKIVLRRKTLFYTINLLMPCVLTSMLSILTFCIPAEAQEKVTLCISILLALVVYLLLVSKSLPPTSVTMPLISKYLFFTFIMNIVTVIVTVFIININFRSPRTSTMPRYLRIIFLNWLPTVMMMRRPDHAMKYQKWKERKIAARIAADDLRGLLGSNSNAHDRKLDDSFITPPKPFADQNNKHPRITNYPASRTKMPGKFLKAIEALEVIAQHIKADEDYMEVCDDWKYIASVMDRFLLYIFLGVTVGTSINTIVDAPNIFKTVD